LPEVPLQVVLMIAMEQLGPHFRVESECCDLDIAVVDLLTYRRELEKVPASYDLNMSI
jgi:hypothetical protein